MTSGFSRMCQRTRLGTGSTHYFGGGTVGTAGRNDVFVASFTAAGAHAWSAGFGDADDQAIGVDVDGAGNVLIVGTYRGDTDFGGGTVPFAGDPLNFDSGLFVAMYDPAGAHLFSQGYGTKANGTGCAFYGNGDMRVLGRSTITIDMGGGPIPQTGSFEARLEGAGGGVSAVGDVPTLDLPLSAAPNPFNPHTVIAYELPVAGPASVTVFNVRGELAAIRSRTSCSRSSCCARTSARTWSPRATWTAWRPKSRGC